MSKSNYFKKAVELITQKTLIILQEFLPLLAGKKNVMTSTLDFNEMIMIKNNFTDIKIIPAKHIIKKEDRAMLYVLSKNKSLALKTIEALKLDNKKAGKLLGYPKCCVDSYFENRVQNKGFIDNTWLAYKSSKKFSFLANNLLNFSSRIIPGDSNYLRYHELNGNFSRDGLVIWYLQFISHIPCRYDCPESIKIGKKIQLLLKKYAPKIEKVVKYTLSKPILFFDTLKLIIFDGFLKNGVLHYKKVLPPFFIVDKKFMEKINIGNNLIAGPKEIKIFQGQDILFTYKKNNEADGFVIDFSNY